MFKKSFKFLFVLTILFTLFMVSNITAFATENNFITLDKKIYKPDEDITITYNVVNSLGSGSWIGLFSVDIPHGSEYVNDQHDIAFLYLNEVQSNTVTLKAPTTNGTYDIRINNTDYNGKEVATSVPFVVSDVSAILEIEPEKYEIYLNEQITADLTINNINEIAAEDIKVKYDNEKLNFLGFNEIDGIKLVKSIENNSDGELRLILASQGEANIISSKKSLVQLNFEGIQTGQALVDITNGRVSDGIEMEKGLEDEECGQAFILIKEANLTDVNNSGEFTLLDLGIDARHLGKDPSLDELSKYNTDISVNNAIDDDDLLEIGRLMLENTNYQPNQY